jgi:hypothetical protein
MDKDRQGAEKTGCKEAEKSSQGGKKNRHGAAKSKGKGA